MFDGLTNRLSRIMGSVRERGRLNEGDIDQTLQEVRLAMLEADVGLGPLDAFLTAVRQRAITEEVGRSMTPGQTVVGIVREELIKLLGTPEPLNVRARPPAVVMLFGLQGAGKTTTAGKLAHLLKTTQRKKVMLASTDTQRPAAREQLGILAGKVGAAFFDLPDARDPLLLAREAHDAANRQAVDVLILDTAGRMHLDDALMVQLQHLNQTVKPVESLLVIDSMMGQDAVATAKGFAQALPLTGLILTKADGDARGGAALSVRHETGVPIKMLGTSEKTDGLEAFDPSRFAQRILGMGDITGLAEAAQRAGIPEKKQIKPGSGLSMEDLKDHLQSLQRMGGVAALLDKLPGMAGSKALAMADQGMGDRELKRMVAIIQSMTPQERRDPSIIRSSRKRRIARGSGLDVQDVNKLIRQHGELERLTKQMGKRGGRHALAALLGAGRRAP
jgi:signal recognition particle subunit SRP54